MALGFRSDFEGGNGELLALEGDEVHFAAEPRRSRLSLWWHVELRGIAGRRVRLVLEHVSTRAGGLASYADPRVRPVASVDGGPWRRLGHARLDPSADTATFDRRFPAGARRARVAFCYPYVYTDVLRACRAWSRRPGVSVAELCTSAGGRAVPLVTVGDPEDGGRDLIAVVARQHAGESPGSFVLEGMMEALTGEGAVGRWARARALVVVVPAVDVDNVAEGGYGKDEKPVDYNRDWLKPARPQIRALRPLLADLARVHRYRVFLDLHAPWIADPNMLVWPPPDLVSTRTARLQRRLARLLQSHQVPDFDLSSRDCFPTPPDWGDHRRMSCTREAQDNGCTSLCVETTYHGTRAGRWASPRRYRAYGRRVALALAEFCRATKH